MTASAVLSPVPPLTAVDTLHRSPVRDVCLGMCAQCNAPDRVYIETAGGIFSRCYQCGDESGLRDRPMSCPRGAGHGG